MLSMTDDSPAGSAVARRQRRRQRPLGGGTWLPEVVDDAFRSVRRITNRGLRTVLDPERAKAALRQGATAVSITARLAAMPSDPYTLFRGSLCTARSAPGPRSWPSTTSRPSARRSAPRSTTCCSPASPARCAATWCSAALNPTASTSAPCSRSTCVRTTRSSCSATASAWCSSRCRSASPIAPERLRVLKERMDADQGLGRGGRDLRHPGRHRHDDARRRDPAVRFFGSKATAVMTNVRPPPDALPRRCRRAQPDVSGFRSRPASVSASASSATPARSASGSSPTPGWSPIPTRSSPASRGAARHDVGARGVRAGTSASAVMTPGRLRRGPVRRSVERQLAERPPIVHLEPEQSRLDREAAARNPPASRRPRPPGGTG